MKLLQAESGQLRRDLELNCEMEVQYAQRGVLQVAPISSLSFQKNVKYEV